MSTTHHETLSSIVAFNKGYRPLTNPYQLPREQKMLNHALDQLDTAGIPCVLVDTKYGKEIWRKNMVYVEPEEAATANATPTPTTAPEPAPEPDRPTNGNTEVT